MSRHGASGSRKISFNVSDQYEIQDVVGEGAYGVVWYVPQSHSSAVQSSNFMLQLCTTQAVRPEGGNQEDYAF